MLHSFTLILGKDLWFIGYGSGTYVYALLMCRRTLDSVIISSLDKFFEFLSPRHSSPPPSFHHSSSAAQPASYPYALQYNMYMIVPMYEHEWQQQPRPAKRCLSNCKGHHSPPIPKSWQQQNRPGYCKLHLSIALVDRIVQKKAENPSVLQYLSY